MIDSHKSHRPRIYQIRIRGVLDETWSDWFEGLTITQQGDDTLLTGPVRDQSALHGIMAKIRDLGFPLQSVSVFTAESEGSSGQCGARNGRTNGAAGGHRDLVTYRRPVGLCLLALLLTFASLAPGGPIENRDFSHISAASYGGLNAFLIILGLAGFASVYSVWKEERRGYRAAIAIGWLYVAVVAADLGRVFPVSPDPTGFLPGVVMVLDAILALNVVLFSYKALGHI